MNSRLFKFILSVLVTAPIARAATEDAKAPDPEVERRALHVADGFEVSLFAADDLVQKPIEINFDPAGRLWVASSETYPQVKPGQVPNDKVLVLEDTNGDGKADKSTVFAEGLLIPTGLVPGDGGVYVANSTEVDFFKDTNGDGKADHKQAVLQGFGTEDTHHIIHTFRWGPDGRIYFNQSIYIHSHIETPRGTKHLLAGGVWRFRPDTLDLNVYCTGLINPWGDCWDYWGQMFGTDGAGGEGVNYLLPGAAFTATPGAARVLKGMNPGSPKYAGAELLSGRHMPPEMQGDLITSDFRANRIVRFKLSEVGAGFDAKLHEFITSSDKSFRPVDAKMGPDGALYIADWYNPIIQHGEVDFRDPRRDHTHGRIWRVTAKGRPLVERPKLVGAPADQLLEHLLDPEQYTRMQAKSVLRERGAAEVAPALAKWVKGLAKRDAKSLDLDHARLEALWTYESIDVPEMKLLDTVLHAKDGHARAAAILVASHWMGKIDNPVQFFAPFITDDFPRVRLEAARALTATGEPQAVPVALKALDLPMDPYLDYALYQTVIDLQPVWLPAFNAGKLSDWGDPKHLNFALRAVKSPDALKNLVAQLKAGQVPAQSRHDVYDLIALTGGPTDLGELLSRATSQDEKLDDADRTAALQAVAHAVRQRKMLPPAGAGAGLSRLFASSDPDLAAAAMRAAGALRMADARTALETAAAAPGTAQQVRLAAVDALALIGPNARQASGFFLSLVKPDRSPAVRSAGVVGLVAVDPKEAAGPAGELFASAAATDDLSPIIAAFLKRDGGADALANALAGRKLSPDVARLSLRYLQGIGQDLPALTEVLRKSAGITAGAAALSPEEMKRTMDEVMAKGDPARGEQVFRSKSAGCFQCHAIGGTGGQLAPDLRSIGAASPLDYIIDSVLVPNKAVKDGYASLIVTTKDGDLINGIKVREDQNDLVLKDNLRDEIAIPVTSIKSRKEGGSLMPAGLADNLTHGEFLDLIRFLSDLGKPGPYAMTEAPVIRRWRVLDPVPPALAAAPASQAPPPGDANWWPAYSRVDGTLPLDALGENAKAPGFARGQFELAEAGKVRISVNVPKGLTLWVDDRPANLSGNETTLDLPRGPHTLTVRVDRVERGADGIRIEIADAPGSKAHATPIGGR